SAGTNFYDVVITNEIGSITSVIASLIVTNSRPCPGGGLCDELPAPEVRLGAVTLTDKGMLVPVLSALPAQRKLVLEYKDALAEPAWKPLSTNDSSELKLLDPNPPLDRSRY